MGFICCAGFAFPDDAFATGKKDEVHRVKMDTIEKGKKEDSIPKPEQTLESTQPEKEPITKPIPVQANDKAKNKSPLPEKASEQVLTQEKQDKNRNIPKPSDNQTKKTEKKVIADINKDAALTKKKQVKTSNSSNKEENSSTLLNNSVSERSNVRQTTPKIRHVSDKDQTVKSQKEVEAASSKTIPEAKKNVPSHQENVPKKATLHSPSNSKVTEGASSKDRSGNGSHTNSLFDKFLLEAEDYMIAMRIQPFISKQLEFRNQWDHAPPSPPPQRTPFSSFLMNK